MVRCNHCRGRVVLHELGEVGVLGRRDGEEVQVLELPDLLFGLDRDPVEGLVVVVQLAAPEEVLDLHLLGVDLQPREAAELDVALHGPPRLRHHRPFLEGRQPPALVPPLALALAALLLVRVGVRGPLPLPEDALLVVRRDALAPALAAAEGPAAPAPRGLTWQGVVVDEGEVVLFLLGLQRLLLPLAEALAVLALAALAQVALAGRREVHDLAEAREGELVQVVHKVADAEGRGLVGGGWPPALGVVADRRDPELNHLCELLRAGGRGGVKNPLAYGA
mmetsp:Transcript_123133/g.348929  ORF Transcript_123133/g.348929 Transcript_123133/m.348929 type:complete len:279 (+) Transcript_123133:1336-2172(+)